MAVGLSAHDRRLLKQWADRHGIPFAADADEAPPLPLLVFVRYASRGPRLQARIEAAHVPPVVIVGVGARAQIGAALAAGCDEYLASPLCAPELMVRLSRHLPVVGPPASSDVEHELALDGRRAELVVRGARLRLRPSEVRLLEFLGRAVDRTVTAAEIVEQVLQSHGDGGSARTLIWNLRRRMRAVSCDDLLVNVRGHGYRLADGARWVEGTT
jgi:DNA-binding response OmpR family regulator